ncbi:anthrone oxygenase family protein [Nocardia sp. KC 131]|uniref:anthrone oxygenase family protein n=1 Tax=Nocardia arseniciresistens TaxID=3392119 RepID=UPI00398F662F
MLPATETIESPLRNPTVLRLARLAGLLFGGIFAGFLVAVLVLELSMRDVDGIVYTQMRHIELVGLDVLATVTLLPTLVATAIVIAITFRNKGFARWLPIVAFALLAGVLILTVIVNLPINADQRDWIVSMPPTDWASVRDRWQISHAVRTVAAVLAFGALCLAAIPGRSAKP